tara:strand:+ start:2462 stop:2629 length:168 start_codon:yes stop_codon:yes gene_type:complete
MRNEQKKEIVHSFYKKNIKRKCIYDNDLRILKISFSKKKHFFPKAHLGIVDYPKR